MMYGFKTAPELTSTRVGGMMKEVEEELNRVIKVGQIYIGKCRDKLISKVTQFLFRL